MAVDAPQRRLDGPVRAGPADVLIADAVSQQVRPVDALSAPAAVAERAGFGAEVARVAHVRLVVTVWAPDRTLSPEQNEAGCARGTLCLRSPVTLFAVDMTRVAHANEF